MRLPEHVAAKVTADWIKLHYALRNGDATDDLIWVVDLMNKLIDSNPSECLRVVERIAAIDQSEFIAVREDARRCLDPHRVVMLAFNHLLEDPGPLVFAWRHAFRCAARRARCPSVR